MTATMQRFNEISLIPRITPAYADFWRSAGERQAIFHRRRLGISPLTTDQTLLKYKFTNVYRVLDRVSQFVIREVIYGKGRSQDPAEVFFRVILFKVFNRIETWQSIEAYFNEPISWRRYEAARFDEVLSIMRDTGHKIFTGSHLTRFMATVDAHGLSPHMQYIKLVERMMTDEAWRVVRAAESLQDVYEKLKTYYLVGRFTAFQWTLDLNYSTIIDFPETFVVSGRGADDGHRRMFTDPRPPVIDAIRWMAANQATEFKRFGVQFDPLRLTTGEIVPMGVVDVEHWFCETSKYTRKSQPQLNIKWASELKRTYAPSDLGAIKYMLPPKRGVLQF